MKESKRKYARYPTIFGNLDTLGLCNVARANGMQIISAWKPDMHVCAEIGLYGTPSAMRKTDNEWTASGNKLKRKKKGLHFGVDLSLQLIDWVDYEKTPAA